MYYNIYVDNLLNFLQHTFFNAKLNHRSRRNLAERQTITGGRRQGNKKKQSIASVIMEPTFERSLMTMSFLMFGVFVIQVVQVLTIHFYHNILMKLKINMYCLSLYLSLIHTRMHMHFHISVLIQFS